MVEEKRTWVFPNLGLGVVCR